MFFVLPLCSRAGFKQSADTYNVHSKKGVVHAKTVYINYFYPIMEVTGGLLKLPLSIKGGYDHAGDERNS